MSLFDRISDKIKDDLILEMNKTGSDDPWDETQQDKIRKKKKAKFKKSLEPSDISKNPDKYTVKVGKTIVDTEIVPKNKKYKPPSKAESDAIQTKSLINKTKKFVNKPAKTPKSKGSGTVSGSTRPLVTNPKSKGNKSVTLNVNKTTVSSDKFTRPNTNTAPSAKEITKKYNKLNKNRPEFDSSLSPSQRNLKNIQQNKGKIGKMVVNPSSAQKARGLTPGDIDFKDAESLYAKRKARINLKTGRATQKGGEDFIVTSTGANRPGQTHLNKKQIAKIKKDAKNIAKDKLLSKPYKDKINKSDYAGKRTRQRPSNAPSYAEIKKQIDAKNPTFTGKSGGKLPVLGGKDSLTRKSGKLKSSKTVDRILGQTPEPGQDFRWKDIRGKGKDFISKTYKPPKGRFGKLLKYIGPKGRKIAGGLAILGTAYTFRKQLTPGFLKKKEPKIKYKEHDYKFNLSQSGGGKGKQANELKNRNIYTGKLIKKK